MSIVTAWQLATGNWRPFDGAQGRRRAANGGSWRCRDDGRRAVARYTKWTDLGLFYGENCRLLRRRVVRYSNSLSPLHPCYPCHPWQEMPQGALGRALDHQLRSSPWRHFAASEAIGMIVRPQSSLPIE